ncbi:hypothetical protein GCM10025783_01070 [Amnibacterium soli]|uniref:Uncharacterized protein n=1 Tax=Amnibacterium soli TaxID=1282736 RepID=A0ABP8YR09_9MICO
MSADEVVLTSRRARWRTDGRGWEAGRLHLTDRRLRLTAHDGTTVEVLVASVSSVRVVRLPRSTLVLATDDGRLRVRCFAVPAVAGLLPRSSVS